MWYPLLACLACAEGPKTTDDTGVVATSDCPVGMVAVGDPTAWCVDPYEDLTSGDLGSPDPYADDALPTTATSSSEEGVMPATNITFAQAARVCEATPATGSDGEGLGWKHLITSEEWEDAGDGLLGEGGTRYPWGDTPEDGRCALPYHDETVWLEGVQPTGSFPDCVSPFGVYDQIGNAWEWMDPGVDVDVDAWEARAAADGRLEVGEKVRILDDTVLLELGVHMVGLPAVSVARAEDGTLEARVGTWDPLVEGRLGYLYWRDPSDLIGPDNLATTFLPITLSSEDGVVLDVHVELEVDGRPFTDKRGGAWYVGVGNDLATPFYDHGYDFEGTIGFRCAWRPTDG